MGCYFVLSRSQVEFLICRRNPSSDSAENLKELDSTIALSNIEAGHVLVGECFVFAEVEELMGGAIGDESPDSRLMGKAIVDREWFSI
jgi:hypothetical protein